jgi:hypothetical protein
VLGCWLLLFAFIRQRRTARAGRLAEVPDAG